MEIERIGVVGAGQMGNGIAHVAALAGFGVSLSDVTRELVDKGVATITKNMDRQVAKGVLTAEAKATALGRVSASTDLDVVADCDLVVEAIVESLEIKTALFRQLDGIAKSTAILASNTSSISITRLAGPPPGAAAVVGEHRM